jgi:N-acetylglutamate synthase-like GNAT family acetyltransferase
MVRAEWTEPLVRTGREDGAPAGQGHLALAEGRCFVAALEVYPAFRGRGYGDFMLRLLLRRAWEMGYPTQFAEAPAAAAGFFRNYDFKEAPGPPAPGGTVTLVREGDITGPCG